MVTLTIRDDVRYQTIEGFGASGSWTIDPVGEYWTPESKETLAQALFSTDEGIGLSIWKFNAGATRVADGAHQIDSPAGPLDGFFSSPYAWRMAYSFRATIDAPYDWQAHAGQRWFLDAAEKYGVPSLQIIFYSPPAWMTKNSLTHPDADSGTTNVRPEMEAEYVRYMTDIIEHLDEEQGFSLDAVIPLNEPNWAWNDSNQEANRYAVEDIKRIIRMLAAELESRGLSVDIIGPEAGEIMALLDDESFSDYWKGFKQRYNSQNLELTTGGKYREYLGELLGDPQINRMLDNSISAHSYWSDSREEPDNRMVTLRKRVRQDIDRISPGARYLQTEYCILGDTGPGRDLTMQSAIHVAEVIHRDLTILNAAEWSWWLALSPHDYKDGLVYTDWERPGDTESLFFSKIFFVLGQYSRFIRPGYIRVDVSAIHENGHVAEDVLVSAFINPVSGESVLVLLNTDVQEHSVRIEGDEESSLYRTSAAADENLSFIGTVREHLILPAQSVSTLYMKRGK